MHSDHCMELDLMELDLEEQHPPVLEYARSHGLCSDYTLERPLVHSIKPPSDDEIIADLKDPANLSFTNPVEGVIKERLAVSKDAVLLLKEVLSMQQMPDNTTPTREIWKRASRLKLELPLVSTDNDLDLLNFGSADVPSFNSLRMPIAPVDEENDEGLQWPPEYYEYPRLCDAKAKAEKLLVTKDGLVYLQNTILDSWTSDDAERAIEEAASLKKVRTRSFRMAQLT
jgi:hypothetical protein